MRNYNHNLRYIQKIADNVGGRTFENFRSGGSTNDTSAKYSVADLFSLVKTYDKEFKALPVMIDIPFSQISLTTIF